ncbi:hypothetical protein Rsub_09211 [Raphidocelis subcapitata]|uniref:Acetylornithine aminotransferase n=1 Tax=Raphidocelis subcapitata TaxID=307507 RepID=A0A2V0PBV3_9CHLO|nr:hypothetical protein Rsub_09211 [Raphidocelis subcapitata]|eukprot:GBF96412.1 hypothetical protein Rsub_09211 [Raphidocelis subcapitata]
MCQGDTPQHEGEGIPWASPGAMGPAAADSSSRAAPSPPATLPPRLDPRAAAEAYAAQSRPHLAGLLALVGLDWEFVSGQGDTLFGVPPGGGASSPVPVLDLLGGYGCTLLGHNHPAVVAALSDCLARGAPACAPASSRGAAGELAGQLAAEAEAALRAGGGAPPQGGYVCRLLNTGTEAVEAAIKHALCEWRERRAEAERRLLMCRAMHRHRLLDAEAAAAELCGPRAARAAAAAGGAAGAACAALAGGRLAAAADALGARRAALVAAGAAAAAAGAVGGAPARAAVVAAATAAATAAAAPDFDAALAALAAARPVVVAVAGSFHGKTAGALAVTDARYGSMYDSSPFRAVFVDAAAAARDADGGAARGRAAVAGLAIDLGAAGAAAGVPAFSSAAAALVEVVRCEAGVRPLPPRLLAGLADGAAEAGAPLVVDEVQTGFWRTGPFLAAARLGLSPDYVCLGKSLGGGAAKASALLVARARYSAAFDELHSSTFAEDEPSARAGLAALSAARALRPAPAAAAARFEAAVRAGLGAINARHPGVLADVRVCGLLAGLEFAVAPEAFGDCRGAPAAAAAAAAAAAGVAPSAVLPSTWASCVAACGGMGYVIASYLLNVHRVRAGVSLSDGRTLRLQPSALLSAADTDRALAALGDAVALVADGRWLALTAHLWPDGAAAYAGSPVVSPPRAIVPGCARAAAAAAAAAARGARLPRAAFLSHAVLPDTLGHLDPLLAALTPADKDHCVEAWGPFLGHVEYHRTVLAGANGAAVELALLGGARDSAWFLRALRAGDPGGAALGAVRAMAAEAAAGGARVVGLGQFTSIVTCSGLALGRADAPGTLDVPAAGAPRARARAPAAAAAGVGAPAPPPPRLTTGNALTVGAAFLQLTRAAAARGLLPPAGATAELRMPPPPPRRGRGRAGEGRRRVVAGVVGATGNIGAALAALLGDVADELVLIGRPKPTDDGGGGGGGDCSASPEPPADAARDRARGARLEAVAASAAAGAARPVVRTSTRTADLACCDLVAVAVNSVGGCVAPGDLKPGAVVLDLSVPPGVSPEARAARPDVAFVRGGFVKLPLGQSLGCNMGLGGGGGGEVPACLGETLATALTGRGPAPGVGPVTKAGVLAALAAAAEAGMELGDDSGADFHAAVTAAVVSAGSSPAEKKGARSPPRAL